MSDRTERPPIAPIDATLALCVLARRAVLAAPRHLLPSAPLLGRRIRRLTRASGVALTGVAFKWRAQREWRQAGRAPLSRSATTTERGAARPASHVPSVAGAPIRPGASAERERSPSIGISTSIALPSQPRPAAPLDAARALAVAPSLVWFARWRETRLLRVVQERRSAPLAGDILRAAVARARPLPHAGKPSESPNTMAAGTALPMVESPSATMHGRAWAPLAAVLRTRLAGLAGDERSAAPLRKTMPGVPAQSATPTGALSASAAARATALSPLIPSAGVATRAALHATVQATGRVMRAVNEMLPQRVAAQVRQDVAQAVERIAIPRPAPVARETSVASVDDRVVTALLGRMRALLREEQFRHGHLR